jgi:hypothetical protein
MGEYNMVMRPKIEVYGNVVFFDGLKIKDDSANAARHRRHTFFSLLGNWRQLQSPNF